MKPLRIVGHIAFTGNLDVPPDPDAAEIDLRPAGYRVVRLPDRLQARIRIPGDDFMQAYIDVTGVVDEMEIASVVMDEINKLIAGYGGACMECGAEEPNYRPAFDGLFEVLPRSQ
jgi:hypothetical protein